MKSSTSALAMVILGVWVVTQTLMGGLASTLVGG
jgi:hypothetical protein